ncbi:MFS transporter [Arenibaculum pallidiluteum]|uniref:MFS transporter n=1 Tax=Arenibaculum pallidiluteum TaxID=2812559 RepID=UPI001A966F5D|nr:MFS transporter [Arenibaculum pallidiluteum]
MLNQRDSVLSIIVGASILQGANGLLQALLPLRMQFLGMASTEIGLVAAAYGAGFVAGCLFVPRFVRQFGYIRAFASLAAAAGIIVLAFTQATGVVSWTLLRALSGTVLAGLFTVADGWISAKSHAGNRGQVLSKYMISTRVALILSPFLVAAGSIGGDGLFMVVNALLCLSLLPVAFTMGETPATPNLTALRLRDLLEAAPSALVGCFFIGLINGPMAALAPVYGTRIGLRPELAAGLLVALQIGSAVMQWPLGWLSDRIDRRLVLAGIAAGTAAVSLLMAGLPDTPAPALVYAGFLAWGGLAFCGYAICVAHASDVVPPERIVPTVSGLLVAWAAGAMLGPVPGAAALDHAGPGGFFLYLALVAAGLGLFVLHRILRLRRLPAPGGFSDVPASSPATAAMVPQAPARNDATTGG